jgi:hypothetical protein
MAESEHKERIREEPMKIIENFEIPRCVITEAFSSVLPNDIPYKGHSVPSERFEITIVAMACMSGKEFTGDLSDEDERLVFT